MSSAMRAPAPRGVVELGAGRRNSVGVSGSRKATGTVLYGGNLSAGNTITVNGTVFTAVASGAAGNQFNVAGSLTLTLDNIVTVLNASVIPAVALATYSNVSGTTLNVSYDLVGVAGNAFTLAANAGTVSAATLTGGSDADVLDPAKDSIFAIVTAAGTAQSMALPAGSDDGHEVLLYLKTKGAGANALITGVFVGGTTLTLDTAGKFAKLAWLNASWAVITNTGSIA